MLGKAAIKRRFYTQCACFHFTWYEVYICCKEKMGDDKNNEDGACSDGQNVKRVNSEEMLLPLLSYCTYLLSGVMTKCRIIKCRMTYSG